MKIGIIGGDAAPGAVVIDTGTYYPQQRDGRIAAIDDAATKRIVRVLIDELGFDTVDADGLDESWRRQPGTSAHGSRGDADNEGPWAPIGEMRTRRGAEHRRQGD